MRGVRGGVLFASLLLGGEALACKCARNLTPTEAFYHAEVAFAGEVVSRQAVGDEFRVVVRVERGFKVPPGATEIAIYEGDTTCDTHMAPGQEWLVFARPYLYPGGPK